MHKVARGDCWWIEFDPTKGSEIKKTRPAVVVSTDLANDVLERVTVVPLTTTIEPVFVSETLIDIEGVVSKAVVSQIRTVSKTRLKSKIATIKKHELVALDQCLRIHLDL